MSQVSQATAQWNGNLDDGGGSVELESGAFTGLFSKETRFGDSNGNNPEELIAAAHASCYSMALASQLAQDGLTPSEIRTTAHVHLNTEGDGPHISMIGLVTEAQVDNVRDDKFQRIAEAAKENCPVSKLCAGAEIRLDANHTAS
jgi:osmotically inducible protein OsmC